MDNVADHDDPIGGGDGDGDEDGLGGGMGLGMGMGTGFKLPLRSHARGRADRWIQGCQKCLDESLPRAVGLSGRHLGQSLKGHKMLLHGRACLVALAASCTLPFLPNGSVLDHEALLSWWPCSAQDLTSEAQPRWGDRHSRSEWPCMPDVWLMSAYSDYDYVAQSWTLKHCRPLAYPPMFSIQVKVPRDKVSFVMTLANKGIQ